MTKNPQKNSSEITFRQRLRAAFERLAMRKTHPPAQPYIPQPGPSNAVGNYSEAKADIQQIPSFPSLLPRRN